tara:strand:+ start:61079 stop:61624 length:546 start_codon:yes stop_codon:yes gene_type:complete
MSDDEDDKPTVVLDINALKEEMAKKKEELEDIASDLEFAATEDESSPEDLEALFSEDEVDEAQKRNVLLFDFNSEFFKKNVSKLPSDDFKFSVISELKDLNSSMQEDGDKVVIFNYNAAPKAVNQLTVQIKAKFPHVKTIIMAKNLSDEKAMQHKKTKSGAHAYLSIPFNKEKFITTVKKV